jgi:hypothetical protein
MVTSNHSTTTFGNSPPPSLRTIFADAARFWEPRRILYNLVLTAVVGVWIVASWPHFRPAFTLPSLGALVVLGLLANACYCAAYFIDIPLQRSFPVIRWKPRRAALWWLGMLLALLMANYWIADEIYPYVR